MRRWLRSLWARLRGRDPHRFRMELVTDNDSITAEELGRRTADLLRALSDYQIACGGHGLKAEDVSTFQSEDGKWRKVVVEIYGD